MFQEGGKDVYTMSLPGRPYSDRRWKSPYAIALAI